ncbi:MAG: excalibur calcium-binding domain-containing protein [Porticoccaceae bacterium]|jgi:hypothetical protein|nr:excalibur calcium-binding domain-containing protein [Porticoccaceae bacterium]
MVRLLVVLLIGAGLWYGYQWYQGGGRLPDFGALSPADFSRDALDRLDPRADAKVAGDTPSLQGQPLKCVTADGRVIYGEVPAGTVCERRETVGGALVVMPRDDFIGAGNPAAANPGGRFRCDGRTQCREMNSCAEAEYFLANCPGTELDGDGDGKPCELQWCG